MFEHLFHFGSVSRVDTHDTFAQKEQIGYRTAGGVGPFPHMLGKTHASGLTRSNEGRPGNKLICVDLAFHLVLPSNASLDSLVVNAPLASERQLSQRILRARHHADHSPQPRRA